MNESDFLKAIEADPCDPTPRLVYADWLDEHGDPRGELIRIQEELRHIDVPNRPAKETRMHELLNAGVEPLMITQTNSLGIPEILIFPGEFVMGSPADEEGRSDNENHVDVRLTRGFWLGKCTVTQSEWQQVMGSQPWAGKENIFTDSLCPATYVSWEDAVAFCKKLTRQEHQIGELAKEWGYTLPTEAQWEYACRAGTTTRFFFGDQITVLESYAWFGANARKMGEKYAHEVGQQQPNPCGLHDMHGNVFEWCRDGFQENLPGGTDPEWTTKSSYRVYRGGCWNNFSRACRSACRGGGVPSYRSSYLGFRMARVLTD